VGELPAPFQVRGSRATRQKKRRENIEFWVKVVSPFITTVAVVVSLYQAHLATTTTTALIKSSLRERITEDRKDEERLKRLTAQVLQEIEKLPSSPWLRADASEAQFSQGKKETSALIKALIKKIDDEKSGLSDPWFWELLGIFENSFELDIDVDIVADDDDLDDASNNAGSEGAKLAKRKSALAATIRENTRELKVNIEYMLHSLDERLRDEINQLKQ